ncbi:MAG TPA: hypothetical protein PKY59_00390 [Pyrinomonadaceae bacterium]|nr:hypothetical protein [Pyrinomonadaceae bacterium]
MKRALILLLFAFFVGNFFIAQAQTGSSVMIYNRARKGTEENSVGNAFEQAFIKGLEEKFPCVDWMNEQTLFSEIQKLREKETLTGELDEKALAALGESVNANYIIVVRVYTLPNGQTVVSARVISGKNAGTVADQLAQSDGGDAAYDSARNVAQKLLQDLSAKFRGECDAHWTGTITYIQKTFKEKRETREITKINQIEVYNLEDYEQKLEVALQPMTQGGKTNFFDNGNESMIMSRISRRFANRTEQNVTETGEETCRQRGANPIRKKFKSTDVKIIDEQGANSEALPVSITIFTDTKKFRIKMPTPEVAVKKTEDNNGVRDFCTPQPFNEQKTADRTEIASYFDFDGQFDAKNPDIIQGEKTTGTLETRQYTIKWNLRMVRPNKKKPTNRRN